MNPREQLVAQLVDAGKSDEEIRQALQAFDARQLPSSAPKDVLPEDNRGNPNSERRLVGDLTSPKKWLKAIPTAIDQATFGGLDEAVAGVMGGGEHNRVKVRRWLDKQNEESGWAGDIGQAAALFAPFSLGKIGAGLVPAKVAGRAVPAVVRQGVPAMATGSAYGALAGGLSAEPGDRLRAAGSGAKMGAAVGGAAAAVAAGGRKMGEYLGMRTTAVAGQKASQALRNLQEAQGIGADDVAGAQYAQEARGRAAQAPDGYAFMDDSPQTRTLARNVAIPSTRADRDLEELVTSRAQREASDVEGDVNSVLGLQRRESASAVGRKMGENIADIESDLNPIFQAHARPIDERQFPDVVDAFRDIESTSRRLIQKIADRQTNQGLPVSQMIVQGQGGTRPTLQAIHELKKSLQALTSYANEAMAAKSTKSITADDIAEARSLNGAVDRLLEGVRPVPGGQQYLDVLGRSARERLIQDQLEAGGEMAGKLQTTPWEDTHATVQKVADARIHHVPIDPTTQRRSLGALRKGVASDVANDLASVAGKELETGNAGNVLEKLRARNVQESLVPLIGSRPNMTQRGAEESRDWLQNRLSQRATMRLANKEQVAKSVGTQEILPGSRAKGTALGLGEAGILGSPLSGGSPGPAARLAAGALFAKFLEGRRGMATERAAEDLARLLGMRPSDPSFVPYYRLLLEGSTRQATKNVATGMGAAAAANAVTGRRDR